MNSKETRLKNVRRTLFYDDNSNQITVSHDVEKSNIKHTNKNTNEFDELRKTVSRKKNVLRDINVNSVHEEKNVSKTKISRHSLLSVEENIGNLLSKPEGEKSTGTKRKIFDEKKKKIHFSSSIVDNIKNTEKEEIENKRKRIKRGEKENLLLKPEEEKSRGTKKKLVDEKSKTNYKRLSSVLDATNTQSGLDDLKRGERSSLNKCVLRSGKYFLRTRHSKEISKAEGSEIIKENKIKKIDEIEEFEDPITEREKPKSKFRVQFIESKKDQEHKRKKLNVSDDDQTSKRVRKQDITKIPESIQNESEVIKKKVRVAKLKKPTEGEENVINSVEESDKKAKEKKADGNKNKAKEKTEVKKTRTRKRDKKSLEGESNSNRKDTHNEEEAKIPRGKNATKAREIEDNYLQKNSTQIVESTRKGITKIQKEPTCVEEMIINKDKDNNIAKGSSDGHYHDSIDENTEVTPEFEDSLLDFVNSRSDHRIKRNKEFKNQSNIRSDIRSDDDEINLLNMSSVNNLNSTPSVNIFKKSTLLTNELKNIAKETFVNKYKSNDKPTLAQAIENPSLLEKANLENYEATFEDLKKCPTLNEKDNMEKVRKKNSYEIKMEEMSRRAEERKQKKLAKAVEKLHNHVRKELKKIDLSSNLPLQEYVNGDSDSETTCESDTESLTEHSTDCDCGECTSASSCLSSTCSCCDSESSDDSDRSTSASCSCSHSHNSDSSISCESSHSEDYDKNKKKPKKK